MSDLTIAISLDLNEIPYLCPKNNMDQCKIGEWGRGIEDIIP